DVDVSKVDGRNGLTESLQRISCRVMNEVRGVNRVAYDVSSKPRRCGCQP
ncbi:MAG: hypothetical protein OXQ26_03390, partial [bacterium]|nr:hypothetical protein [bacterium]